MGDTDTKARVTIGFLSISIAVLLIFACSMLMNLRAEVRSLKDVLATKSDLVAVRTAGIDLSYEQRKCTTCHTERRFAGEHATKNDIARIIKQMEQHPDTRLTHQDVERIHASLTLMRCTSCHSSEEINKLSLMDQDEQAEVIREMQRKPGSGISPN